MSFYEALRASEVSISQTEDGNITAIFCFNHDLELFKGHFPGRPILPGIAQFEMVKYAVEKILGMDLNIQSIKKSKFSSQIAPGQRIELLIKFSDENKGINVKTEVKTDEKTAGKLNIIFIKR